MWYRLGNDTPKTQIYDLSLSWCGTGLVTIPLKHKYMTSHSPGVVLAWLGTGLVTIPLKHKYMTSNVPGLVQLRLGNDTPKTQIYDLSLSWLGTGLVAIPLKHKNILPLTFLAWYTLGNDTPNTQIYETSHFPGLVHAW